MSQITNDIRILHDFKVMVSYGPASFEGHVVYIRHLTDTYNEQSFDELDEGLKLSISNMRYVEFVEHTAELLDTTEKVDAWNERLKKNFQYVASFWNQWTDTNHFMHYMWISRQIVYASVFSECPANVATFHLLGCIVPYSKEKIDKLIAIQEQNPAEMFQNHPLAHSVTCFIDKSTNDLLCYYRHSPTNTIVRATYNLTDKSKSIAKATTNEEYIKFETEYGGLKLNKNIWYIGLNNQTKCFIEARDAILSEISQSDDAVLKEFAEYLSVMQEA